MRKHKLEHWQLIALLLMAYDIVAVNFPFYLALWIRFDCVFSAIDPHYLQAVLRVTPIYTVICLVVFWFCKLYNSIWRYASISELVRVCTATAISAVAHIICCAVICPFFGFARMPISYYFIGFAIQFLLVLGIRFSYRLVLLEASRSRKRSREKRVMIIGAGNAGQMILRDVMRMKEDNLKVCCLIDDNPNKWGRYVEGIPVVGGRDVILKNVEKHRIEKIFIAVPSATAEEQRDLLNICKETGCELKNLPGVYQLVSGQVSVGDMKDVAVEDLLGRDTIRVNMSQIYDDIRGKVILVTGGGGSIGSELCRQVAAHHPKQLILLDVYENNAYDIQQELREEYPTLDLVVLIGSVRDSRRMECVFRDYRPNIVYHAAAHKHVPLMEVSPCESIKNNVIGTYKTAYAAMSYGCDRFVLISTDKAVNPTNIMGASKRLCEMVVQLMDRAVKTGSADKLPVMFTHRADDLTGMKNQRVEKPHTEFVAVRFGNVLGSNGSVIPLFKKQIARGGPVTVTHPDIIRYFMTIPEAVSLVMQAGTYASGGEIFVLDMGAPVKIDELARNLIKLSGYKPDEEIKIVYTGLRPGEKLYEEKLMAEEGMQKTENDLIHIGSPIPFDTDEFLVQLDKLMHAAYENEESVVQLVAQIVPTFHPAPSGASRKDATYEKLSAEMAGAGK